MNVYEYAMNVEKEGEAYYRELAKHASNPGIKRIFIMLAEEEVKHYNIFYSMMKNEAMDLNKLNILTDTKTIFNTLIEEKDNVEFNLEEIKYYKEAIQREENSRDFYKEKAEELRNDDEKSIFLKIAQEEEKHKKILEEIVIFLEEPADWIASAEF